MAKERKSPGEPTPYGIVENRKCRQAVIEIIPTTLLQIPQHQIVKQQYLSLLI
jgi:hypothetical protein